MTARSFIPAAARDTAPARSDVGSRDGQLPVAAGAAGGAIGLPCAPTPQPVRPRIVPTAMDIALLRDWRTRRSTG